MARRYSLHNNEPASKKFLDIMVLIANDPKRLAIGHFKA